MQIPCVAITIITKNCEKPVQVCLPVHRIHHLQMTCAYACLSAGGSKGDNEWPAEYARVCKDTPKVFDSQRSLHKPYANTTTQEVRVCRVKRWVWHVSNLESRSKNGAPDALELYVDQLRFMQRIGGWRAFNVYLMNPCAKFSNVWKGSTKSGWRKTLSSAPRPCRHTHTH